ncbi:centromere protein T isoform X2 [Melanotaenia boesemani]|uniref:centromere protein T isoform X2 n=1 Tax=Melanotaenia boesemani TaxID=1250792 RepID=UPI001C03FEE7|nr:centromere protein T isoform X2 [Melanotaenia boesemani]
MDLTEDLTPRVLLKHILVTEPPRTPVTRSETRGQSSSGVRRRSRQSNKKAETQTPQSILRRSLREKIREDITRKSLPATKRRTGSVVFKRIQTPAATSLFLSDGDTPRYLLRNILQTEPVKSPVVHEKRPSEQQYLASADKNATRTRPSVELSGLDLPDITISHEASTAKGLSRKRPRRSFNVTAFEKRLKDGDDAEEEADNSTDNHSSLSASSSTSLTLKTPFVDVRTEKKGLQRKISNRRKITEEEFGAAVNRRQMGVVSSYNQKERDLSEMTYSEDFSLGLSKLEPDITTDIVNCNTALYDLPDAMTSNISIVATQDKPTVMASQLQRGMQEIEQEEEVELMNDQYVSEAQLQEDVDESEPQNKKPHDQQENAAVTSTSAEEEGSVRSQTVDTDVGTESEEVEAQTGDEAAADSDSEEAAEANDQFEGEQVALDSETEEEEGYAASQVEMGKADSQSDNVEAGSQSDEEEVVLGSEAKEDEEEEGEAELQSEDVAADSQSEDVEAGSQSEEEVVLGSEAKEDEDEEEEEEGEEELQSEDVAADSQSEDVEAGSEAKEDEEEEGEEELQSEDVAADSQSEGVAAEEDEDITESQSEDDHQEEREEEERASEELELDLEHTSRWARRSKGALVVPITEAGEELAESTVAGRSDSKSKAHIGVELNASLERRSQESSQLHSGSPGGAEPSVDEQDHVSCPETEPEAGKGNSFNLLQVTHEIEISRHLDDLSPEGIPAPDSDEKDEEWEEDDNDDVDDDGEEGEEFPSKTPAFVREKRNFFLPDPQASPSVFRDIEPSTTEAAAKPKQVKQRKTRPSMKKAVLPKAYLMSVFKHFAKTKVSADVFPVLNEIMDKFLTRMADDLETYANHAKRTTIDFEDAKLLLKRQGYVNDKVPVEVLIEKYLRMEQRKLLIPIATSGNVVIPKRRR